MFVSPHFNMYSSPAPINVYIWHGSTSTCVTTAWKVPTLGVGDVAEVDVAEVPDGRVAVDVVVNGAAYERADVVN